MPPYSGALWSHSGQGVWLKGGEFLNKIFQTLLFLRLSFLSFFLLFFLCFFFFFCNQSGMVLGCICNGSIIVTWTYLFLFCVIIDAYWRILMRFDL